MIWSSGLTTTPAQKSASRGVAISDRGQAPTISRTSSGRVQCRTSPPNGAFVQGELAALHVEVEVAVAGHLNHLCAHQMGGEAVHAEGGRGLDYLVALTDEEADYQVYQLVAAVAGDDAFRRRARIFGQGFTQGPLLRVGVAVVLIERAEGLGHLGRGAVGVLVAVQPNYLLRGNSGLRGHSLQGPDAVVARRRS